jgi:hypothetical protein
VRAASQRSDRLSPPGALGTGYSNQGCGDVTVRSVWQAVAVERHVGGTY